jgi:hypothetical protein
MGNGKSSENVQKFKYLAKNDNTKKVSVATKIKINFMFNLEMFSSQLSKKLKIKYNKL